MKTSPGNIVVGDRARSLLENIQHAEERTDFDFILADLVDIFSEFRQGTDRIRKIIADIRNFTRPGDPERQLTDINQSLDAAIKLVPNNSLVSNIDGLLPKYLKND